MKSEVTALQHLVEREAQFREFIEADKKQALKLAADRSYISGGFTVLFIFAGFVLSYYGLDHTAIQAPAAFSGSLCLVYTRSYFAT